MRHGLGLPARVLVPAALPPLHANPRACCRSRAAARWGSHWCCRWWVGCIPSTDPAGQRRPAQCRHRHRAPEPAPPLRPPLCPGCSCPTRAWWMPRPRTSCTASRCSSRAWCAALLQHTAVECPHSAAAGLGTAVWLPRAQPSPLRFNQHTHARHRRASWCAACSSTAGATRLPASRGSVSVATGWARGWWASWRPRACWRPRPPAPPPR